MDRNYAPTSRTLPPVSRLIFPSGSGTREKALFTVLIDCTGCLRNRRCRRRRLTDTPQVVACLRVWTGVIAAAPAEDELRMLIFPLAQVGGVVAWVGGWVGTWVFVFVHGCLGGRVGGWVGG